MNTRGRERVPYADLHMPSPSGGEYEDSNDGEFVCNIFEKPEPIRGRPRSKSLRVSRQSLRLSPTEEEDDDTDTFRLPLSARVTGFSVHDRVADGDPRCLVSPRGKACSLFHFEEIQHNLLNPEAYFPKNSTGVNVLMPEWDVAAPNKLQFFGIEAQIPQFDMRLVEGMTDDEIQSLIADLDEEIAQYETVPESVDPPVVVVPYGPGMVTSIRHDVTTYNWEALGRAMQFDVILMDPPWRIQPGKTTRGVSLDYEQMKIEDIQAMPLHLVQKDGYVFMWVVASVVHAGAQMLKQWGYELVSEVNWIKVSKRGVYHPSNGYYLQHSKETCLIGRRGRGCEYFRPEKLEDTIITWRNLRQSHKPEKLYDIIEEAFPECTYLEIFARAHNLRDGWVSIGLELP